MRFWKLLLVGLIILMLYLVKLHRELSSKQSGRKHSVNPVIKEEPYTYLPDPETTFLFENTPPSSEECVKTVLIYGNLTDMKDWPELSNFYKYFSKSKLKAHEVFYKCPTFDCVIKVSLGTSYSLFQGKDAIIFGMLPKVFEGRLDDLIERKPEDGQTWIFYSTETPLRIVNWNRDVRIGDLKYHKIMSYRLDSDIHIPFAYYEPYNKTEQLLHVNESQANFVVNKTKDVIWIGSNCKQIFWPRIPMMQRLQRLIALDDFGKCGRFHCLPKRSARCADIFRKYHFYLAFANSECYEYITEKFWWNALGHDVIPVVYGAPKSDFEMLAPPNSYIHISDFYRAKELVDFLTDIKDSSDKYKQYFKWKERGRIVYTFPNKMNSLCNILPHLGSFELKRLGNSSWFNGCRRLADETAYNPYEPKQQRWDYILWSPWNPNSGKTIGEEKRDRMEIGKF